MRVIKILILTIFLIQSSFYAKAGPPVVPSVPEAAKTGTEAAKSGAGESGLFDKVGDFFSTSAGVATLSGISAVLSGILWDGAAKQEEDSEDNIKKIEKIIGEFNDSFIFFCPKGRDDLTDANCYCYNDDGKKNPNRTKSQTCQSLWSKNDYKLSASAGLYSGGNGRAEAIGCMTRTGQFDERCNCRKFVDSKGNNSCFKASSISLPNNEIGSSISKNGLQDAMKMTSNAANGNPNFGGMNAGQLVAKAIDNKKFHENLLSKVMSSGAGSGLVKVDENNVFGLAKAAIGEKAHRNALETYKPFSQVLASNAPIDASLKSKVGEAAKKAGITAAISGGSGLQAKGETKKDMNVSVNVEGGSGVTQIQNLGDSGDQKTYRIKNDINKDKGASLFEIISNRYINSGLRRLFEKE